MARTHRNAASSRGESNSSSTASGRRSQISHALSKLLRHQAENEKIRITPAGWVRMDDLLAWRGLSRIGDGLTISDVFEVVEEDGKTGKGRFGLKLSGSSDTTSDDVEKKAQNARPTQHEDESGSIDEDGAATGEMIEATSRLSADDSQPDLKQQLPASTSIDPSSKNGPETQLTIQHHLDNPNTPASHYLIRATQGHTIRSVGSVDLLTPITLDNPSSIPSTVVHGTFYGAWPRILSSAGLKPMGRNNVHFATGPSLEEVLSTIPSDANPATFGGLKTKTQVDSLLSREKVISGMRWDAQILIYIDLKRCLEDIAAQKLDMTWWRSDNGVILTEGVIDTIASSTQQAFDSNAQDAPSSATIAGDIRQGEVEGKGEVLIASKHAKAQKHRENIQQQNESHPEQPSDETNEDEGGEVLIASKEAKMQKHRENMQQERRQQKSPSTSLSTDTTRAQRPQQDEAEVIIASKHAKAQKHQENVERQSAETPQPQSQPSPQQQQQELEEDTIIASKHAKEQKHQENLQDRREQRSTEPDIEPEILLASSRAKAQKHRENTRVHGPRREGREDGTRLVPLRYVTYAIEIKAGLGVLWQRDRGGLVKELPESLKNVAVPRGKDRESRVGRGRGRG